MYDPRQLTPPDPSEWEVAELEREGEAEEAASEICKALQSMVEELHLDDKYEEMVWERIMRFCELKV